MATFFVSFGLELEDKEMRLAVLTGLLASLISGVAAYTCDDFKSTGLPCVEIPTCASNVVTGGVVNKLSNGLGSAKSVTKFRACYDESSLSFEMNNYNQYYYSSYNYGACNDNVFNSDVVEVFIAPWSVEEPTPHCYSELDVAPSNKIFQSGIYNPNLNHTGIKNYLIDCESSGVASSTEVVLSSSAWIETLTVPWSVVDNPNGCPVSAKKSSPASKVYRFNVYRVNELSSVSTCSTSTCEYMAWSPTLSNPPAFHEPTKFGYAVLV